MTFHRFYKRIGFWQLPENQYWHHGNYSDKAKNELDKWANSLYKLKIKQEFQTRSKL